MKIRFHQVLGILLVLLGVAALIHPHVTSSSKQDEVQFGSQKFVLETTHIYTIPWYLSTVVALAGAALFFSPPPKR